MQVASGLRAMSLKDQLNPNNLPKHIAIIMDGNGRWAKANLGKGRIFGHKNGIKAVREATEGCAELGIENLTLYAFSTENWDRPRSEVNALMKLLVNSIKAETPTLQKNQIKLNAIGQLDKLPGDCQQLLEETIENTKENSRMTLTLALSYSGRWELTQTMKRIASAVASGSLKPDDIDQGVIQSHLATNDLPDPELMIRTSGEHRISNYLLWQIAYAELYFTDVLWPDFDKEELYKAIYDYQKRERRFGKISEQLA